MKCIELNGFIETYTNTKKGNTDQSSFVNDDNYWNAYALQYHKRTYDYILQDEEKVQQKGFHRADFVMAMSHAHLSPISSYFTGPY